MSGQKSIYTVSVNALNLPLVGELCDICQAQNDIIRAQADALAQVGAVVMEEVEDVNRRLSEFLARRDEE
jgi:hypothetical protein